MASLPRRAHAEEEFQANGEPVHFTTSLTGLNGRVVVATPLDSPDASIMQLHLLSGTDPLANCNGAGAAAWSLGSQSGGSLGVFLRDRTPGQPRRRRGAAMGRLDLLGASEPLPHV